MISSELMTAINAKADLAEEAKPSAINLSALANELCRDFGGHTVHAIHQQLVHVWRVRGLNSAT
jgi:hypothetical protein